MNSGFWLSHYWAGLVQETPSASVSHLEDADSASFSTLSLGPGIPQVLDSLQGPHSAPHGPPIRGASGRALLRRRGRGGPTLSEGVRGKRQKNTYQAACLQINGVQTRTAPSAEGMHSSGDRSCLLCVGLGPSTLHLWPQFLLSVRSPGFPARRQWAQDVQVSLALRLKGEVSEVRSRGASAPSPQHGPPSEEYPFLSTHPLILHCLTTEEAGFRPQAGRLGDRPLPRNLPNSQASVGLSVLSPPSPPVEFTPNPSLGLAGFGVQLTTSMLVPEAAPAFFIPWDPGLSFLPVSRTSLHLHILIPPAAFPIPPCHFPPLLPSPCPAVFTPVPVLGWDFYGASCLAAISGLPPSWTS